MRYVKKNYHKYICLLFVSAICILTSNGQDAISTSHKDEVLYLIDKYVSITPDFLRGLDSSVWNSKVERLLKAVDSSQNRIKYIFALRFFSSLLNDEHAAPGGSFPSQGFYNKNRYTNEKDTVFPVTVKTFKDGRTFVIKDYSGSIPIGSELLKVNNLCVDSIGLLLEELHHAEKRYSLPVLNYFEQPDIRAWCILSTHLFMEGINQPFEVEYRLLEDTTKKSVVINGMMRGDIFNEYKRSGDKRNSVKHSPFSKKPIEYTKINDSIALLNINIFLGLNSFSLPFINFNSRYERLLRRAMNSIEKLRCKHLIIDIRENPGGYLGNIFHTLNYFTADTLTLHTWYKVSKESKEVAVPVLRDTYKLVYGKKKRGEQNESIQIFLNMQEGLLFRPDTLLPLAYSPVHNMKHRFNGKLYVLSDALSYSASILFCSWIKQNGIGMLVGEAPGGFVNVRGGMTVPVKLPSFKYQYMNVPYSVSSCFPNLIDGNDYLKMDYEIGVSCNEWLNNNDGDEVLKRVIKWIMKE